MTINNIKTKNNEPKPTNAEILQAFANDSAVSREVASTINEVGTQNMSSLYSALTGNPSRRNEFVSSLYNPTIVTMFYSKFYQDKLAYFLNGDLAETDSIQQIYVQRSLRKGFAEHFDVNHNSVEGDLIARVKPVVFRNVICTNFQHKFKVSVDMRELKKAMLKEYGLFDFIGQLLASNINGANKQEFDDIHALIDSPVEKSYMVDAYTEQKIPKGLITQAVEEKRTNMFVEIPDSDPLTLAEKIIQYSGDLEEYSSDFSLAQDDEGAYIETFTNKDNLVMVMTNEMRGKVNVQALAQSFNIEFLELPQRILTVKSFTDYNLTDWNTTTTTHKDKILGILMDKDAIQCWDTFKETGQFTNVEGKFYNSFLHHEGIKAQCPFCQFVVFYTKLS